MRPRTSATSCRVFSIKTSPNGPAKRHPRWDCFKRLPPNMPSCASPTAPRLSSPRILAASFPKCRSMDWKVRDAETIYADSLPAWRIPKPNRCEPGLCQASGELQHGLQPGFKAILQIGHKLVCDSAIDDSVVERQHQVDHRADCNRVVADDRPLFDHSNAQNGNLGLVDDRRSEQAAENAGIRYGEGAFLHLIHVQAL